MNIVRSPKDPQKPMYKAHLNPATLILDERGMIRDCSKTGEELFGYRRSELAWQHVSKLFPQLSNVQLIQNGIMNPHLEFLCHFGQSFRAQNQQGDTFDSELHFVHLNHRDKRTIRLIVSPARSTQT